MADQVSCQCATMSPGDPPDVLGAIDPADGTDTQCENAVGHCSAPAFQWGYRFGGNGRASVYDLSQVGYTGRPALAKDIDLAAFCACRAYADKSYMQNDDRTCQDSSGADSAFVCDPSGVSTSLRFVTPGEFTRNLHRCARDLLSLSLSLSLSFSLSLTGVRAPVML